MAFSSSGLNQIAEATQAGAPALWAYRSSDSSTTCFETVGYLAATGVGSRGLAGAGLRIGDIVLCQESSAGATPYRTIAMGVKSSTANQASTTASSGYSAAYDCTLQQST